VVGGNGARYRTIIRSLPRGHLLLSWLATQVANHFIVAQECISSIKTQIEGKKRTGGIKDPGKVSVDGQAKRASTVLKREYGAQKMNHHGVKKTEKNVKLAEVERI